VGLSNPYDPAVPFKQTNPRFRSVFKGDFAKPGANIGRLLAERQMKLAISIGVAVVLPFGFLVLAGIIVNHVLAKRRQPQPDRLQPLSASTK
jgi:hypothetical protein